MPLRRQKFNLVNECLLRTLLSLEPDADHLAVKFRFDLLQDIRQRDDLARLHRCPRFVVVKFA